MDKGKRTRVLVILGIVLVLLLVSIFITNKGGGNHESIKLVMRDAVIHEENKMSLFGLTVNPSLIAAYIVTAILLVIALLIRIFAVPHFKTVPGKFQMVIEMWVGYFDNLAKTNSPHLNKALGAYVFAAGSYIFVGTIFELFGVQWPTIGGESAMALPAPLCDINGAIAMGVFSYGFIMSGGIRKNKIKGVGLTLKEFSLPISMSFRLFCALLSGTLVTELVYYSMMLSFVLPVLVGILFTLIHAVVQAYVLTMLTSIYYGEVSEVHEKKPKVKKKKKEKADAVAEA